MLVRLHKYLSEQGVASRRKAEEFIRGGHVSVNGRKAMIGQSVDPEVDKVKVYGKEVSRNTKKIYLALNKPKRFVVSKRDPQGRRTVFSLLPEELRGKVWNIGRLDYDTEGLLLLTNDGELTQKLAHPKFEHDKEYQITPDVIPDSEQLSALQQGVKLPSGMTSPAKVRYRNGYLFITIHEGKKHQVRRMCDAVGIGVKNLRRIRIGKLKLPNIPEGEFAEVTAEDII